MNERAKQEKANDKKIASKSFSVRSATFDLQSVLSTPCSNASSMYYARKLDVFNFTILEQNSKNGFCYVWDESNGRRGASEVGTCLNNYIQSLPQEVKTLTLFSDCCGGQNRNQFTALALLHAVNTTHVDVIEHKFLVSGHTQMECDSMHSCIERSKRHVSVHSPEGWYNVITLARRGKPYTIIPMEYSDFLDFKKMHKGFTGFRRDTNKEPIRWLKVRVLKVEKGKDCLFVKYDFSGSFHEIMLKKRSTLRNTKKALNKMYRTRLGISVEKKDDLVGLCIDGVVPRQCLPYYENLPACAKVNRVPEPDIDDDSLDSDVE